MVETEDGLVLCPVISASFTLCEVHGRSQGNVRQVNRPLQLSHAASNKQQLLALHVRGGQRFGYTYS